MHVYGVRARVCTIYENGSSSRIAADEIGSSISV